MSSSVDFLSVLKNGYNCISCTDVMTLAQREKCFRCAHVLSMLKPLYLPQALTCGNVHLNFASAAALYDSFVFRYTMMMQSKKVSLRKFYLTEYDCRAIYSVVSFPIDCVVVREDDIRRDKISTVVSTISAAVYSNVLKKLDPDLVGQGPAALYVDTFGTWEMKKYVEYMAKHGVTYIRGSFMRSHMPELYDIDRDIVFRPGYYYNYRITHVDAYSVHFVIFAPHSYPLYEETALLKEDETVGDDTAEEYVELDDSADDELETRSVPSLDMESSDDDVDSVDDALTEMLVREEERSSGEELSCNDDGDRDFSKKKKKFVTFNDSVENLTRPEFRVAVVPGVVDTSSVVGDQIKHLVVVLPHEPHHSLEDTSMFYLVRSYDSYLKWREMYRFKFYGILTLRENGPYTLSGVQVYCYKNFSTRENAIKNWVQYTKLLVGSTGQDDDDGLCYNTLLKEFVKPYLQPYDWKGFLRYANEVQQFSDGYFSLSFSGSVFHISPGGRLNASEVVQLVQLMMD